MHKATFLAAVRVGRAINPAALSAIVHDLARKQFAFSTTRRYCEQGQTKGAVEDEYCALFEHEYGQDISRATGHGLYDNQPLLRNPQDLDNLIRRNILRYFWKLNIFCHEQTIRLPSLLCNLFLKQDLNQG